MSYVVTYMFYKHAAYKLEPRFNSKVVVKSLLPKIYFLYFQFYNEEEAKKYSQK